MLRKKASELSPNCSKLQNCFRLGNHVPIWNRAASGCSILAIFGNFGDFGNGPNGAYNLLMAKSSSEPFEVGCPCCNAVLKVDPDTKAVLSHVAAVKPKMFNDFEAAAKAMREQEGRKESIFRQAVDAQKNNASLLEKKFQEAVKKAKETPDEGRPLRDFDLD
jgi:hypothetical protein